MCVLREREREKRPWNVIVFFIPAFYFSIWNFWFFFFEKFWPEAKLEPFSFLFWISSIHPSFIRGPLRLGYLIFFFFFLPGTKTKTVSPESENARVCVCACAFALSYYIQQCERRRERESGAHRRPSGLYFFSEMIETERIRDGRKEIPFVFDLFLSLSLSLTFRQETDIFLCFVPSFGWMISEAHSLAPGGDSRGLDHSSICELVSTWAKERKKLTQKKTKNPKKKMWKITTFCVDSPPPSDRYRGEFRVVSCLFFVFFFTL